MARKWFQLVGEDGNAMSPAAVILDIEDVATLRDAVKAKCSNSLANVDAAELIVFDANGGVMTRASASVHQLGIEEDNALIVQVPQRVEFDSRYFIQPSVQGLVEKAAFVILVEDDDEYKGGGMGVFFTSTLAVTCDHNLTAKDTVGSVASLALKNEIADVEVVARNPEVDFAIFKSSTPRSFIPLWSGRPDQLRGRYDLVLASYRLGFNDCKDAFDHQLGFAPVAGISINSHERHIVYLCSAFAGDSGAALLLKDRFLVGIHLTTVNALREEMDRKKVIKDRLNDVEESLDNIATSGLAQGCLGHAFKNAGRDECEVVAKQ